MSKLKKGGKILFTPDYPRCQGCENLCIGAGEDGGWGCLFKPDTNECEYPDNMERVVQAELNSMDMDVADIHDLEERWRQDRSDEAARQDEIHLKRYGH